MSINIKEIFQSDNLSVSQDKINYNFDQILANGGGPQGLKGEKGSTGAIGSIGPKGDVGPTGLTGQTGLAGADGYFTLESYTTPLDQHTLLPKIKPELTSAVGQKPTNLVLGRTDTSYAENDIDKNALLVLSNQTNGQDFTDLIRFRLIDDDPTYGVGSAAIRVIPTNDVFMRLKIMTLENSDILELQSDTLILSDRTNAEKIKITSSLINVNGPVNFAGGAVAINAAGSLVNSGNSSLLGTNIIGAAGKTNTITGTTTITGTEFRINPTGALPVLNKILVAQDVTGKAVWKNPTEVEGIYPIGTIVFVSPTDIIDEYFNITNSVNVNEGGLLTLSNFSSSFFGRGKSNKRWAGWYLLMGQTNRWDSGSTMIQHVPTNVPGSILIGASAPDDAVGVTDDVFDSSMATKRFNPVSSSTPNGYGLNYLPQLRGTFNGVGAGGTNESSAPRDLISLNSSNNYSVLKEGSIETHAGQSDVTTGNALYPQQLSFMPLPMAIYLGRTDLVYNRIDNTPIQGE